MWICLYIWYLEICYPQLVVANPLSCPRFVPRSVKNSKLARLDEWQRSTGQKGGATWSARVPEDRAARSPPPTGIVERLLTQESPDIGSTTSSVLSSPTWRRARLSSTPGREPAGPRSPWPSPSSASRQWTPPKACARRFLTPP